jgi:hypothetical protein
MGAEKGVAMRPGSAIASRPRESRSPQLRREHGAGACVSDLSSRRAHLERMRNGAACEARRSERMVSSGRAHDAR